MALLSIISLLVILITSYMSQISPTKLGEEAALPPNLAHRLSPLSSTAISRFTAFLSHGTLAQHSAEFCQASGITCRDGYSQSAASDINIGWTSKKPPSASSKVPAHATTIDDKEVRAASDINIAWTRKSPPSASSKIPAHATTSDDQEVRDVRDKHIYFREKELFTGGQFFVSSLANVVPARPFLPKAIASKLPFSTSSLPHLTALLGIPTNSYLSKSMALSLQECETQRIGEEKMCATSMEDMLQFGTSNIYGSGRIQFLYSDAGASTVSFPQAPTFQQVVLKVPAYEKSVVCHDVMFPFALYSCHQIPNTKVYEASWTTSGKLVRAAAVCHMNTTGFHAAHPAFAALYMHPGDGEVCHWVNEGNLIMSEP